MVQMSVIEARLSQLGVRISWLYKPEVKELQQILVEGEKIFSIVPGRYFGGFALLAATDRRLLLIDKKSFFLTVEDIRYDMISEVDFSARMMDASMVLFTVNKQHHFTCFKYKARLREMTTYVQQKVMEIRYGVELSGQSPGQTSQPEPLQPASQGLQPIFNAPALRPEPEPLIVPLEHHHLTPHTPQMVAQAPAKVRQLVGAAALHGTPMAHVNPYTRTSFMMRKQYSRFG